MRPALKAALSRLTDQDRTDILAALLQGDLGGSEAWADAIWPVEQAFVAAFPVIERTCDPIPMLRRYWNDPAFAADVEAERAREQAKINASIDAAQRRAWERNHGITA